MKLTQDQIQFLEAYLIKNKVKYWDVRMELLDHIATDVQERMQKGQSFEDALKEVHLSFGNTLKSKRLSGDQKRWIFTTSIYADNSGYKKLIETKAQALSKVLRTEVLNELLAFFRNPLSLVAYILLLYILFAYEGVFANGETIFKFVIVPLIIISSFPLLLGLSQIKQSFRSLYVTTLTTLPMLTISLFNLFFYLPQGFIMGKDKSYPSWYLILLVAMAVPIVYVQVKLHITRFRSYQKLHKKYFA